MLSFIFSLSADAIQEVVSAIWALMFVVLLA